MLTKDLLRHRNRKGRIYPQFLDPADARLLECASALIHTFQSGLQQQLTRQQLSDQTQLTLQAHQFDNLVGKGLEKLLLDRAEFETGDAESQARFRDEMFRTAREALQDEATELHPQLADYWKHVQDRTGRDVQEIQAELYADLPPQQKLRGFRSYSAEQLLHRYNCAQVQGLLLHCESLELTLQQPDSGALRQLFKYVRFHQLLSQIQTHDAHTFCLRVDGPLSLFYKTQKYGLQLANFFPAILLQERWELRTTIQFRQKAPLQLWLDASCNIRSHYRQFHDYIPEEFQQVVERLHEKHPDWSLTTAGNFVSLGGQKHCFPDFVLQHSTGAQVALELFHGWHAAPLQERLEQLAVLEGSAPLLLGVSRSLLKNQALLGQLEESSYFQSYGFLFRELPTTEKLWSALKVWWQHHSS